MAFKEIYVDPSVGSGGDGSIGTPYGDLEAAIVAETHDTAAGTRVNIKAGTDHVLTAALETSCADTGTSIAWVGGIAGPIIFQGYTATAGDGGIGGISGGGLVSVMGGAVLDYIFFIDLHLHNCGAAAVLDIDNNCAAISCEVDGSSGAGISIDLTGLVFNCYVHDIGGNGIEGSTGCRILHNRLVNGVTNKFNLAIQGVAGSPTIHRNIISLDGASTGINSGAGGWVTHNSVFSAAGTGIGINGSNGSAATILMNNIVEGFSGSGGRGYDYGATNRGVILFGGNCAYNNETDYDNTGQRYTLHELEALEILTASAFTDAASGDFSPVDTGSVKEGALPQSFP